MEKIKEKKRQPSLYPVKVAPYLDDIARYIRCGVTEGQICTFYGIGKTQWTKYKKDHEELSNAIEKARSEHKTKLISVAQTIAEGYEYTETQTVTFKDKDGNITGYKITENKKFCRPDPNMVQFLLINRYHAEFARDPQVLALRKEALKQQKDKENGKELEGI